MFRLNKKTNQSGRMLSEDVFVMLLEHERQRAERSGNMFCLLHIRECDMMQLDLIISRIDGRNMRLSDAPGHFRNGIGLLLPDTELAGAERIQDELLADLGLDCRIYVFPSDHLPEWDEERQQESRDNSALPLESLLAIQTPTWKRWIDLMGASVGLILLSPLLLITAVAIRISSPGPAMFTQRRAGLGGRPFTIFKFRTMVVGAKHLQAQLRSKNEQDGPAFKISQDPRVTWLGRYLRKTCIDELPQLWNVLLGDMSLVGPRPLPLAESAQVDPWQRRRLLVTPGVTCIWQAKSGKDTVPFPDWMRMDIRYIRRPSPLNDLRLILRTATNVLMHRAST